jgi:ribose transport system ATP-binding protein
MPIDSGVPLLHMQNIRKTFPGVVALDGVDFLVRKGEIHAIVGENGAGKSTLMKILAGVYQPDWGEMHLNGQAVEFQTPNQAIHAGIGVIYQEIPLVPPLTVLANVFLGREPVTAAGAIDERGQRSHYQALCDRVGVFVDPNARVRDLSRGQQQLVEILKVLDREAQIIVMDEPTAALDQASKQALFASVKALRQQGATFVFITHFIGEVFELADTVTVLRDGRKVTTLETRATTPAEVVSHMIGHALDAAVIAPRRGQSGTPLLEVRDLSAGGRLHDVNLALYPGEILGLAGLVGSGRSELALALFGHLPLEGGEVLLCGHKAQIDSPHDAIRRGIGLLPEDRKRAGLILDFPIFKNLSLSALKSFSPRFVIRTGEERRRARETVRQLRISTPSVDQRVRYLSGGNQQKVVLGRILATDIQVLILDEPTQGIDVGAKEEIFHLMRRLADDGKAIIFISSEFKEIVGVCDRALVLKDGRIVREYRRGEITEAALMHGALLGAVD